jgi:hypothetical protein
LRDVVFFSGLSVRSFRTENVEHRQSWAPRFEQTRRVGGNLNDGRAAQMAGKDFLSTRIRNDVHGNARQINTQHCLALRRFGTCSETRSLVRDPALRLLTDSTEKQLNALLDETTTSLFSVTHNKATSQSEAEQWWCLDALVDQLLIAREMAHWSEVAAQIMTGVDERVLMDIMDCGVARLRTLAKGYSVNVRWTSKEIRRTMGMVMLDVESDNSRPANAGLLIACNVARIASRQNIHSLGQMAW